MANVRYEDQRYYGRYETRGTAAVRLQPEKIRRANEKYRKERESLVESKVRTRAKEGTGSGAAMVVTALVCAALLVGMGFLFFSEIFALQQGRKQVETLKMNYQAILHENDLTEDRLENSLDFEYIYEEATGRLGMALPGKNQVITYERTGSEYVTKTAEIPHE